MVGAAWRFRVSAFCPGRLLLAPERIACPNAGGRYFKPGLHQKFVGGETGSIGQFATAKLLTTDVAQGLFATDSADFPIGPFPLCLQKPTTP
jgi:hypothetical protein